MIGGMQGHMPLHNETLKFCFQGDPRMKTLGIPLGVIHPGSMGTMMSYTQ